MRRNLLGVLARVQAGAVHGLYGYLDWLSKQVMIDTADQEYLARWASIWGLKRKPASAASGDVNFTGTDGTSILVGTRLQTSAGVIYTTNVEAVVTAGSATVSVTALEAGVSGNLDTGTALKLISPIAGVNSGAKVATGLTGGADAEDDAGLRKRLLNRIQQPPQGGAAHDYVAWALAAHTDVTRAWVYPGELGLGTVTVRLMSDAASVDGIPSATVIQAVQDYIDVNRPVTAAVTVVAPAPKPLDFTIAVTPNTQAVRDAVTAELEDLLLREAEPGATILLSHIKEAISIAPGEANHVLSAPSADVTHNIGEIAVMGAITWV